MSQSGGKRKPKVVKRTRPTRTIKRKARKPRMTGGNPNSSKFIRSPLMDMPPHVQMDTDNPVSAYLADYYMNTDIEKLTRKMFGAAIDEVYNKHNFVVGRAQPSLTKGTASSTASHSSGVESGVEKARPAPRKSVSVTDIFKQMEYPYQKDADYENKQKQVRNMRSSIQTYSYNRDKAKKAQSDKTQNIGDIVYDVMLLKGPFKITSELKKYDAPSFSDPNVSEERYEFDVLDMQNNQKSTQSNLFLLSQDEILDWYNNVWPRYQRTQNI